jgi:nicotinamide-nucleotide amidase
MQAEIITTGSELLLGELVDTNSTFIAKRLRSIGLNLYYKTTVGDNVGRMVEALRQALARSDVIITTGGLGPTVDDVTRQAVAEATGCELVFRQELLDQIAARFRGYGVPMGDNNRQQAYIPGSATAIENPVGTAPAFLAEYRGRVIISLPGVPREMEYLMDRAVLPMLRERFALDQIIVVRNVHAIGLGESRIDAAIGDLERLDNPTVGLSAHPGQTDVRITAKGASEEEARALIAPVEARVRDRLPHNVYGADDETIEAVVVRLLTERGLSLLTVEQGSRGQLAGRLSAVPGAEVVFHHGLVLPHLGAPVEKAAEAMRQSSGADLVLGVAVEQPVEQGSTLQITTALVTPQDTQTQTRSFGSHPALAAEWGATAGLGMLWRYLQKSG